MMPNFLIIGANKAGTTSLFAYFKQHPQVFLCPVKEPMFFMVEGTQPDPNRPDKWPRRDAIYTLEAYEALFVGVTDQKAIGEASTGYLSNWEAPYRIRRYIPDAKLIALLRDPAERAFSAYLSNVQLGIEPLSDFVQAIREESLPYNWRFYVRLGFYYSQLKHYLDVFDSRQIKVYLYDDFKADPIRVIQDICRFLEVDDCFVPDMSVWHNVSVVRRKPAWERMLSGWNLYKPSSNSIDRAKPRDYRVGDLKRPDFVKPTIPPEARRMLVETYREDILQLQDLIHRDLSTWLK